jgi:hypothetical protein
MDATEDETLQQRWDELFSDVVEHGVHPLQSAATRLFMGALPNSCPNATLRNDLIVLEAHNKAEGEFIIIFNLLNLD